MEEKNATTFHIALNAAQALGRGFDVNYDTRLLYCKGAAESRVVEIDEYHTRDLSLYDNLVLTNVSRDIKNFQEPGGRDGSNICSYNETMDIRKYKLGWLGVGISLEEELRLCVRWCLSSVGLC